MASAKAQTSASLRLDKPTSNLFRDRKQGDRQSLDVRDFNSVIEVDTAHGWVEVEGMTTYAALTDACLERAVMPSVVPQLKSITIGGAVAGIGIESSSFKYGLVHETVDEMEILLGDGSTVVCAPDNEHRDLFYGFPNSYGTLGYALKLRVKTVPVKPYVQLEHIRHRDADAYFRDLGRWCGEDIDFLDGTVFGPGEYYLTVGRFVENAPYTSDYTFEHIYYRSIRERKEDYLTVGDYIWRWDTDWFWCSKNVYVQNLPMRLLLGRKHLNSITYQKVMRWNERVGLVAALNRMLGRQPESVIQDVDIPIENAPEFLRFFLDEIGIRPVWMCPIGGHDPSKKFPLYPLHDTGLFVNFGFWDIVPNRQRHERGYYNRKVEDKVRELGGVKSLYSDAYYDEDSFWQLYDGDSYFALKRKYDPKRRLKNLYQKCVLKQ